jgi:hypothetical protein
MENINKLVALDKIISVLEESKNTNGLNTIQTSIIIKKINLIDNMIIQPLSEIVDQYKVLDSCSDVDSEIIIKYNNLKKYISIYSGDNSTSILDLILATKTDSHWNERKVLNYLFKNNFINDDKKLKITIEIYKNFLGKNFCRYSQQYLVMSNIVFDSNINREIFQNSKELSLIFKKIIESFDNIDNSMIRTQYKSLGIKLLNYGLVSLDYEKIIDSNSSNDGLKKIITKLVDIENYGVIKRLMYNKYYTFDKSTYFRLLKYSIDAINKKGNISSDYTKCNKVYCYLTNLKEFIYTKFNKDNDMVIIEEEFQDFISNLTNIKPRDSYVKVIKSL